MPVAGTAAGAAGAATTVQTTPRSPGSGDAELVGSWHSSRPGSPAALTARVLAPYDPAAGSFDEYEARVRKQAGALEILGQPLDEGVLDKRNL